MANKRTYNLFEQIKYAKEILTPITTNTFTLRGLVLQCVRHKVGLKKTLNSAESQTYDLLLKHNLKPKTVYEWLLLEDAPAHIRNLNKTKSAY